MRGRIRIFGLPEILLALALILSSASALGASISPTYATVGSEGGILFFGYTFTLPDDDSTFGVGAWCDASPYGYCGRDLYGSIGMISYGGQELNGPGTYTETAQVVIVYPNPSATSRKFSACGGIWTGPPVCALIEQAGNSNLPDLSISALSIT